MLLSAGAPASSAARAEVVGDDVLAEAFGIGLEDPAARALARRWGLVDAPGEGPGVRQQTAPINPRDTAALSADVEPGRYRVAVEGDGIEAATVTVGAERASAQNEVLQP